MTSEWANKPKLVPIDVRGVPTIWWKANNWHTAIGLRPSSRLIEPRKKKYELVNNNGYLKWESEDDEGMNGMSGISGKTEGSERHGYCD